MLGLKLNYVSKRGPSELILQVPVPYVFGDPNVLISPPPPKKIKKNKLNKK